MEHPRAFPQHPPPRLRPQAPDQETQTMKTLTMTSQNAVALLRARDEAARAYQAADSCSTKADDVDLWRETRSQFLQLDDIITRLITGETINITGETISLGIFTAHEEAEELDQAQADADLDALLAFF